MSNKGNFSQAMREILGLDSSQDKAKVNEGAAAASDNGENYTAASQTPVEPTSNDRLNQDFSQAFNQSAQNTNSTQNTQNMGTHTNQNNDTYGKQQGNTSYEEPAFFDRPGYGQSQSAHSGTARSQSANNNFSANFNVDTARANNGFGGGGNGNNNGNGGNEPPYEPPYSEDEVGTTIITRNTIVEGNIKSFENIELNGKVKGKIDTTKNVGVSGFVQGDILATDILLEGAQIKGNISSKGALLMDKDTLLVGDVEAQNTRVDGKIKGEVNIGGNGEFLSNSVVVGNITVSNFYVQYGARMQGYINTNFSKNEEDSIFGQIVGS